MSEDGEDAPILPKPTTGGDGASDDVHNVDAEEEAAEPAAPAEEKDAEGPRMRERRERAERRAAQARATAIEDARREAKRKVRGETVEAPKALGRSAVRGLKLLTWLIVQIGRAHV